MQFNLVNDQEQVAQFVRHGMALALGFISIVRGGGVLAAFVAWACISLWGAFPGRLQAVLAVSCSYAY